MCDYGIAWEIHSNEAAMTDIEAPTNHLPPRDTYRILTLENPENIEKLKAVCKTAGHEVVPVLTVREAMKFLDSKDHVDVIISAVHLANESVFDFLQRVKARDSEHREVRFLMLCVEPSMLAMNFDGCTQRAGELLGADKYILMPEFDADRLMEEVELLLPPIPSKEVERSS
jgi:CheY-like chemotaxis protein